MPKEVQHFKLSSLPSNPEPDSIYYINKGATQVEIFATSSTGIPRSIFTGNPIFLNYILKKDNNDIILDKDKQEVSRINIPALKLTEQEVNRLINLTNTSDLTNDGFNGVNAFITEQDLPTYSLSPLENNIFSLIKDGEPTGNTINLSSYLDNTDKYPIDLSLNNETGLVTITFNDSSTITEDFSSLSLITEQTFIVENIESLKNIESPKDGQIYKVKYYGERGENLWIKSRIVKYDDISVLPNFFTSYDYVTIYDIATDTYYSYDEINESFDELTIQTWSADEVVSKGDRRLHGDIIWQSKKDHTTRITLEPGNANYNKYNLWELTQNATNQGNWSQDTLYDKDTIVSFNGNNYVALEQHFSRPALDPEVSIIKYKDIVDKNQGGGEFIFRETPVFETTEDAVVNYTQDGPGGTGGLLHLDDLNVIDEINNTQRIITVTPTTRALGADISYGSKVIFENGVLGIVTGNKNIETEQPIFGTQRAYPSGSTEIKLVLTGVVPAGTKAYMADDNGVFIKPEYAGYFERILSEDQKVTPEMFGAIGNDTTYEKDKYDSQESLQDCFDSFYEVYMPRKYYTSEELFLRRNKTYETKGYEKYYHLTLDRRSRQVDINSFGCIYTDKNINILTILAHGIHNLYVDTSQISMHNKAAVRLLATFRYKGKITLLVDGNIADLYDNEGIGTRGFMFDALEEGVKEGNFSESGFTSDCKVTVNGYGMHTAVGHTKFNKRLATFTNNADIHYRTDFCKRGIWLEGRLDASSFVGIHQTRDNIHSEYPGRPANLIKSGSAFYNVFVWDYSGNENTVEASVEFEEVGNVQLGHWAMANKLYRPTQGKQYILPHSNLWNPEGYFPTFSSLTTKDSLLPKMINSALNNNFTAFVKRGGVVVANAYKAPSNWDFEANTNEASTYGVLTTATNIDIINKNNIGTIINQPPTITFNKGVDYDNDFVELILREGTSNTIIERLSNILSVETIGMSLSSSFKYIQLIKGSHNSGLIKAKNIRSYKFDISQKDNSPIIVRFIGKNAEGRKVLEDIIDTRIYDSNGTTFTLQSDNTASNANGLVYDFRAVTSITDRFSMINHINTVIDTLTLPDSGNFTSLFLVKNIQDVEEALIYNKSGYTYGTESGRIMQGGEIRETFENDDELTSRITDFSGLQRTGTNGIVINPNGNDENSSSGKFTPFIHVEGEQTIHGNLGMKGVILEDNSRARFLANINENGELQLSPQTGSNSFNSFQRLAFNGSETFEIKSTPSNRNVVFKIVSLPDVPYRVVSVQEINTLDNTLIGSPQYLIATSNSPESIVKAIEGVELSIFDETRDEFIPKNGSSGFFRLNGNISSMQDTDLFPESTNRNTGIISNVGDFGWVLVSNGDNNSLAFRQYDNNDWSSSWKYLWDTNNLPKSIINKLKIESYVDVAKTSSETLDSTQGSQRISVDASSNDVVLTLPTAISNKGLKYKITAYDATNTVTINTTLSEEIREDVDTVFTTLNLRQGEYIEVVAKTTHWEVIDDSIKKYYWEDAFLTTGQAITADTDTTIDLTSATIENSGRLSGVINTNGTISPPHENGYLNLSVTFNFETPVIQGHLDVFLEVDGVKYRNYHHNMAKANTVVDTVTATFGLPIKSTFFTNGGTIKINSTEAITITDKYVETKI